MQDFRNLDVWQRARRLNKAVYEATVDFPKSEMFGLRSQIRRAVISICSNIAEGCGRRGDRIIAALIEVKRMLAGLIASLKVLPREPARSANRNQPLRISRRRARRRS